jgi:two-component system response regulator AtoC
MSLRILLAESEPGIREALEVQLARAGYEPTCVSDAQAAIDLAGLIQPEVCFWGLLEEGARGRAAELARGAPDAYWIAVCEPDRADAVRPLVLELGFDDLLEDPGSDACVDLVMRRAVRTCRARRERRLLGRDLQERADARPIVGASPAMIELLEALENAAGFPAHVLLQGEAGTGKEGLARAIHAQSARRRGPFLRLSARGGDSGRVAAELFGSAGDAGTPGRLLDGRGGVLFLEDVDALSDDCQERLLEALESEEIVTGAGKPRRIDVRVIAATHRELGAIAAADGFRADLHARLAGVELRVPPLRERSKDIPLLIDHFLTRASQRLGRPMRSLSDEALAHLVAYPWPGNVRELENVIERAVLLARGDQLTPRDLPERLEAGRKPREGDLALRRARKALEADLIRRALRRTGGNRTRAARLLEISHRALLYKLKEYGIRD